MRKFAKSLSIITLALMLTTFCVSAVYLEESSEEAKQILEKTFNKYMDLIKKDGTGVKSVAARLSLKGGGQVPMGDDTMPLDLDVVLEIYAERPRNLYISLVGNLGNAAIVVSGEKKQVTVLLPNTKQFATLDVPEDTFDVEPEAEGAPEEMPRIEELWKQVIVTYAGTEETKIGKAHKIELKPRDPSEKAHRSRPMPCPVVARFGCGLRAADTRRLISCPLVTRPLPIGPGSGSKQRKRLCLL